jgi:hypothetical protein
VGRDDGGRAVRQIFVGREQAAECRAEAERLAERFAGEHSADALGLRPACTVAPLMSKNAIEASERVSRRRSVMSSWFTTIAVGASRTGDERRTSCSGAGKESGGAAGRR